MSVVALSSAVLLSITLLPLPVLAQAPTSAPAEHACLRLTSQESLDGLDAEALGQLLLEGRATAVLLEPDVCVTPGATQTGAGQATAYVEFVAHGAGAAVELARLADRSRGTVGLRALDRAAQRLLSWARRHRRWLDRHPPEPCYADVHRQWRAGVVQVREGAKDVRRAIRTLRPAPMRRAVRRITSGAADLASVDLGAVTAACARTSGVGPAG